MSENETARFGEKTDMFTISVRVYIEDTDAWYSLLRQLFKIHGA